MKENKRPQVRPITPEEWLDMLIPEQQTPTEKENVSRQPNDILVKMKKNLNSICK